VFFQIIFCLKMAGKFAPGEGQNYRSQNSAYVFISSLQGELRNGKVNDTAMSPAISKNSHQLLRRSCKRGF
jgi:hypothetical protein